MIHRSFTERIMLKIRRIFQHALQMFFYIRIVLQGQTIFTFSIESKSSMIFIPHGLHFVNIYSSFVLLLAEESHCIMSFLCLVDLKLIFNRQSIQIPILFIKLSGVFCECSCLDSVSTILEYLSFYQIELNNGWSMGYGFVDIGKSLIDIA